MNLQQQLTKEKLLKENGDLKDSTINQIINIKKAKAEFDEMEKKLKEQLLKEMEEHKVSTLIGKGIKITTSSKGRRKCDWDTLEMKYPEAYKECVSRNVSAKSLVFTLEGFKNENN